MYIHHRLVDCFPDVLEPLAQRDRCDPRQFRHLSLRVQRPVLLPGPPTARRRDARGGTADVPARFDRFTGSLIGTSFVGLAVGVLPFASIGDSSVGIVSIWLIVPAARFVSLSRLAGGAMANDGRRRVPMAAPES